MKRDKIIFYVATALLTFVLLFSVGMYFFKHEDVAVMFTNFGYPTYIIYPYAVAKILAVIVIWFLPNETLKEWAYAGLFYAFILAFFAHFMISDGEQITAIVAMISLLVSYVFRKRITNV